MNNNGADWLNAYVPLPNNGPVGYIGAHKVPTNFSDTVARVDQNISDKASLFVRFSSDTWTKETVPALWSGSSYDTTATNYIVPARQAVAHFSYNFKPTLMNEFVMSYTDTPHTISTLPGPGSIAKSNTKPSDWNASVFFPANAGVKLLPSLNVGGGVPFGWGVNQGNYRGPYDAEPVYTYRDNVALLHGKHTIKFGFFLEKFQLTEQFGTVVQGYYNFTNSGPLTTGNGLADMFLGRINSYQEGTFNNHGVYTGGYGVGHWRRTDFEPYIQDDWKVSHRLTMNFGVRYYYLIPPHDVSKPTVDSGFEPSLYNPALASVLGSDGILHKNPATGQIYDFSGYRQRASGMRRRRRSRRAARCLTGRTSVPASGLPMIQRVPGKPRFVADSAFTTSQETATTPTSSDSRAMPRPRWGQPAITSMATTSRPAASLESARPTIQSIPYYQKNPSVNQYNLNVQHEFRGSNIVSVAYVGTQGRHLDTNRNLNQLSIPVVKYMTVPALAGTTGCDASGVCDVQQVLIHNSAPVDYFRYYQGFGNIRQKQFTAVSSYNALQANIRHTTSHGLTLQAAYTWAHMIDNSTSTYQFSGVDENYDMNRWKGTSDLNRTQVLMLNYIYALPFFKHSSNAVARQALGGWQISGITSMFTGEPQGLSPWSNCGVAGYSTGIGNSVMCNTTGPLKIHKSMYNDPTFGPTVRWFDPSVLSQPTEDQYYANGQPGMFGYGGRNGLTGPGRNNFDLALFKEVALPWFRGEQASVQFRLETFNSFNHTQWLGVNVGCNGNPNNDGTPAFGRTCGGDQFNAGNGEVGGTWDPRQVELGMKFSF